MNDATLATAGPRAGRREWVGLAVLALPTLLISVDVFVMLLALPHLSAGLGADSTQQLWIMDVYSFMIAGFLVTMGTLGDRIGRRKLLLIGAAAFGAASVLAAYSTSPEKLIAARALLGNDVGVVQDAQMLGNGRAALRELRCKRFHRRWPGSQMLQDRPAGRIGDGPEDIGFGGLAVHYA